MISQKNMPGYTLNRGTSDQTVIPQDICRFEPISTGEPYLGLPAVSSILPPFLPGFKSGGENPPLYHGP